jgi:hypothetical protein
MQSRYIPSEDLPTCPHFVISLFGHPTYCV